MPTPSGFTNARVLDCSSGCMLAVCAGFFQRLISEAWPRSLLSLLLVQSSLFAAALQQAAISAHAATSPPAHLQHAMSRQAARTHQSAAAPRALLHSRAAHAAAKRPDVGHAATTSGVREHEFGGGRPPAGGSTRRAFTERSAPAEDGRVPATACDEQRAGQPWQTTVTQLNGARPSGNRFGSRATSTTARRVKRGA